MTGNNPKSVSGFSLSWLGWWFAIVALLSARAFCHLASSVELFPPEHSCLVGEATAWNSLATMLLADWQQVPLYVAVITFTISIGLAIRSSSRLQPWVAGCTIVFLCLLADFDQVIPSSLLLLLMYWSPGNRKWMPFVVITLIGVIGFVGTLEFGLIWTACLCRFMSLQTIGRKRFLLPLGLAVGIAVVAIMVPHFGRALIRPVSAGWWAAGITCFPKLASPFSNGQLWQAAACIVFAFFILIRQRGSVWPIAFVLTIVGLTTSYYLPICAFGLAGLFLRSMTENPIAVFGQARRIAIVACLAACGLIGWKLLDGMKVSPLDPSTNRVVDTTKWKSDTPVLLTNLDHARLWSAGSIPVVINDRWDCVGKLYAGYDRVVKDIRRARKKRTLLSNGQWGGFGKALQKWNPAAIEFSSNDFSAIRQTSLDPDWNIAAIDSTRTVFVSTEHSLKRRSTNTMRLLYRLEWPRANGNFDLQERICLGTHHDSVAVASVLNAIRFPYAALRLLPTSQSESSRLVRLWSGAEVSHRTLRQTGRPDLVHHVEAMVGLKEIASGHRQQKQREFAARQVKALSIALRQLAKKDVLVKAVEAVVAGKVEQDVGINQNSEILRPFQAVFDSVDRKAALFTLLQMRQDQTLSLENRSEASFLAGSLLLDEGQSIAASEAFQISLNTMKNTPFRQLILLHLGQLAEGGS